jgi:integrase/recombinase XerD
MSFPENDSARCSNSPSFKGNAALKIITSDSNSPSEDFNAERKPGNSKSSVVRKRPGKPRGARSMGRYPFLAWANKYLEAYGANYAEATRMEYERRYRRMNGDMMMLVRKGKMRTSNPKDMNAEDVLAYIGFLKSKGLKESAICHDQSALNNLLIWIDNTAVEKYRMKYKSTAPKRRKGRLPPLEETDLQVIQKASEKVADNDWKYLQAYALVLLSVCAGLRTKELRLSRVDDLDITKWMFHAERVKGESTYGEPRDIPIRPESHKILTRYLNLRDRLVKTKCPGNIALFPALTDRKGDGYFATNSLQKLKALVEKDSGINFDFRKCRRTFGQMAFDKGMTSDSVSLLMGHNSTKTTEEYYGRRKIEMAIREAQQLWYNEAPNLQPCVKSPLIDSKYEVTGYV